MKTAQLPLKELALFDPPVPRSLLEKGDEQVAFIPMALLTAETGRAVSESTRPAFEVRKGFTYFQNRDILLAKITPCFENGKIAQVFIDEQHAFGSTEFHVIRPNREQLDERYLFHFLRTKQVRLAGERRMTGSAGQRRVPKNFLQELLIPVPSLRQQRRIAAILDQADALRTKRRQAIAKLDTLTRSLFFETFDNASGKNEEWPKMKMSDIVNFRTGKLDSNAGGETGLYPFFTCSKDDLRIDNYAFDCEALLLAGNNAVGDFSVKHFKGKFNAYQRTYVITVKDGEMVYSYLKIVLENKLQYLKQMSKGTGTRYLTLGILEPLTVTKPPIELQQKFDRMLQSIRENYVITLNSLNNLNNLFTSLQYRAFRGEL